jgi:hypothetical protein
MDFQYKDDWPQARARLEAWWKGELVDRCACMVTAPREGVKPREVPAPADLKRRWTDPDYVIEKWIATAESTFWGGERIPSFFVNTGPTTMGQFLGCEVVYQESTTWKRPFVEDWDRDFPTATFDPENENWKDVVRLTEAGLEAAPGRFMVGVTDLGGFSDVVSAARGPERLCIDLIDCPEKVARLRGPITEIWKRMFDTLHAMISRRLEGCIGWQGVWAPGSTFHPQDDFSCMISVAMFDRVFLPPLREQFNYIDYNLYHLDGPSAIRHLDSLLACEDLEAIQWVHGAGHGPMTKWIGLLKRIREGGKRIIVFCEIGEVEHICRELSSKGMLIATTAPTEAAAKELLKKVAQWTHE